MSRPNHAKGMGSSPGNRNAHHQRFDPKRPLLLVINLLSTVCDRGRAGHVRPIAKGFLLCHILDVDASQTKISVSLRKFLEVKQHISMGSQESCLRLRHTPAPAGELTQQFPATSHLTIASRHVSKTESVAKAGFRDELLATGVSKTGPKPFVIHLKKASGAEL